MKRCPRCKRDLPWEAYGKETRSKTGYRSACKECIHAGDRKRPPVVAAAGGVGGPTFRGAEESLPAEADIDVSDLEPIPASARCRTDVLLPDVHAPDEVDVKAWRCALQMVRELKPQRVIIMGDFVDSESFSRHAMVNVKDARREFEGAVAYLQQLRDLHRGEMVFLEGNHERWPEKWAQSHQNIASMVAVRDLLEVDRFGITWIPENSQPYRLAPNLLALHGHQLFQSMPPKYHARTSILGYSESIVYGHTHRPDFHQTERNPSGVVSAYGLGCLRSLKPEWNKGPARSSSWAHGIGIVEHDSAGFATVYMVSIRDGRATYAGREFRA